MEFCILSEPMSDTIEKTKPQNISLFTRFKFSVVRRGLWLVAKCTSLNGLYFFTRCFGICEWILNYKRRARFHQHMKVVLGKEYDRRQMKKACRSFFVRSRCDKVFYLIFDLLKREEIIRRIHFPAKEQFDASFERGKGVYIALSHFGAHHVAALLMCFMGYELAGVRDRSEGPLRRYIQQRLDSRFSEIKSVKIFFADDFPRDIYRWFQNNGLLGSALDTDRRGDPHLKRLEVGVFGEKREYLTGTMQIALRCQAAIHQGFVICQPNFHYQLTASLPLINSDSAEDTPQVLQKIMQTYAGNIEQNLRKYPDHISRI